MFVRSVSERAVNMMIGGKPSSMSTTIPLCISLCPVLHHGQSRKHRISLLGPGPFRFHHSAPAVSTHHRVVHSEGSIGSSWLFVQDIVGSVRGPRPVLQPISQLPEMGYSPPRWSHGLGVLNTSISRITVHRIPI